MCVCIYINTYTDTYICISCFVVRHKTLKGLVQCMLGFNGSLNNVTEAPVSLEYFWTIINELLPCENSVLLPNSVFE